MPLPGRRRNIEAKHQFWGFQPLVLVDGCLFANKELEDMMMVIDGLMEDRKIGIYCSLLDRR